MRSGRKVAVVRMEMHADEDLLVAVGTGTYMIG
jgi:acyl-coenzyme A thioesterase PaaI-like protein